MVMRSDGSRCARRLAWILKITGLCVLGVGVFLQLADLLGWLRHEDRQIFLRWALQSRGGLPISDPGAQAFVARFPPPEGTWVSEITQVAKESYKLPNGPALEVLFSYMRIGGSKTSYVATLPEVREWASESWYPWLSWVLSCVGFTALLGSTIIQLLRHA